MNKDINDLRDRLFAALDGLADKEKPLEIERAKAIADVARVIVDTAKAEIQFLHITGARGSGTPFIPTLPAPGTAANQRRLTPAGGGCQHCGGRMRPGTNGGGAVIDVCENCGR